VSSLPRRRLHDDGRAAINRRERPLVEPRQFGDAVCQSEIAHALPLLRRERPAGAHEVQARIVPPRAGEHVEQHVDALARDRAPDVQHVDGVWRGRGQSSRRAIGIRIGCG
jgi:hypothetical protein